MLHVPRVIRFATWAGEVLRGRQDAADLRRALVEPQDEPHRVSGPALAGAPATGLPDGAAESLLALLAARGASGVRAVLPEPGDVAGLPGPAPFNVLACEAGQAAVSTGTDTALGLVPLVAGYGSELEPGELVTWQVHPVQARPHLDVADLGDADRQLRRALLDAARILTELDVARWRPEAAEVWAEVAGDGLDPGALPPSWPDRAAEVLASALRLRAVTTLALDDDGGAVSGWEAERRRAALRDLDRTARRAAAAAAGPFPDRLR